MNSVSKVATLLAAAHAYLDATEERGLAPDQVCYRRPDHRY